MLYAVIDVGSNSVRLSVYQCENGNIQPLTDKKDTVGLAGYVENGIMVEEMRVFVQQHIAQKQSETSILSLEILIFRASPFLRLHLCGM